LNFELSLKTDTPVTPALGNINTNFSFSILFSGREPTWDKHMDRDRHACEHRQTNYTRAQPTTSEL